MLERTPGVTLYHQIKKDLEMFITTLPNGTKIPTEQELSLKYGVSRGTVRQAIAELVSYGQLYKIQGSGTYKGSAKVSGAYLVAMTFTEQMLASGKQPGIADVSLELVPADPYIANIMHIEIGRIVFKLARTRLVDDLPIAHCTAYIRAEAIPNLQASDLKMSFVAMLSETFHLPLENRRILCKATPASKEMSRKLGVPIKSPVMYMEHTGNCGDFAPLFIDVSYFNDNYSLEFNPERIV
ncbi:MAG: GntR family transcriptional regulator [Eubacteriales bacterium]|nr:GntR family transcriptional regulator [Eubacteriales bacterium]